MSESAQIIETTEQTFEADVIERSAEMPVVVDFWAPWCGPCRQLTPVLEALASEFAGRLIVAKVNTDEQPNLAAAFRIQSIPTVAAVREGQVVDLFQGALPESAVREWILRIIPSEADRLARSAAAIESTDAAQAEALYRQALQNDAAHVASRIGLARLLLQRQELDEAAAILEVLESRGFLEPEAEKLRSQLHVQQAAAQAGGVEALRKMVAEHPDDLAAQVRLAEALAAAGALTDSLDLCLDVVRRDRAGVGQSAKEAMIDILNTLEDADLASEYRRKLASLLY